jgi:hypothetical protein
VQAYESCFLYLFSRADPLHVSVPPHGRLVALADAVALAEDIDVVYM